MNFEGQPFKTCLFPTNFQCHLLRFACSVVGKNEKHFSQMVGFSWWFTQVKRNKKTSPQNQTNPKNISTCWIFCSTLKHTERALPSDMILRTKMTWNANPLKLPRSKWKNWDMSLLHSLGFVFWRGKFHREKWWMLHFVINLIYTLYSGSLVIFKPPGKQMASHSHVLVYHDPLLSHLTFTTVYLV